MTDKIIGTKACKIAITESDSSGPPVLMIHGNSSCKEVFRNQLIGTIGRTYRCIAMDLPGHGNSDNARNPETVYCMEGYADTALELMGILGCDQFAMLGWSLGGHIGLEMLDRSKDRLTGLLVTGTPPIGKGEKAVGEGFKPSEHMHLAGQREFTDQEVEAYARATCGINAPFEGFLRDAVARTDGRAREMMLSRFVAGTGCNQQEVAVHAPVPLAIVNGADEPFVNNEFVSSLHYDSLWENNVHLIDGIGHAPFWEAPRSFDPYLKRFLASL